MLTKSVFCEHCETYYPPGYGHLHVDGKILWKSGKETLDPPAHRCDKTCNAVNCEVQFEELLHARAARSGTNGHGKGVH